MSFFDFLQQAVCVFGLSPAFPQQLWKSLKPPQTHNWLSFCHYGPHEGPDCWRGASASETVPWRGREKRMTEGPHMPSWTGDPLLTRRLYWGLWESAASVKSCWRAHGKPVCAVSLYAFWKCLSESLCCWSSPVKVWAALAIIKNGLLGMDWSWIASQQEGPGFE